MELNALLAHPVALPSLPRAVALLMTELSHDEPSLRRVAQLIGTDPALAARLLELANTPAFQMQRQIAGIPEALALLGVVQLRSLVSSAPLGTTSRSVPGVNLQQFWRYSLNTAKLARSLAGLVHHNQIAAYTAGLLHAVGELLLHLADPETVLSINTLVSPLDLRRAKIEQRILEVLSGWLATEGAPAPRVLEGANLDLAVARGAAYHGYVARQGRGVRIRGGTAQSYYVGVESNMPAIPGMEPPISALCLAPFGMEEGSEVALDTQEFGLVVGEPVLLRFFGSSVRRHDSVGTLLEFWGPEELLELPEIVATLPAEGRAPGEVVPVRLHARVTDIGTLELLAVPVGGSERWKVELQVRTGAAAPGA